jgi:signal transduction histidine kinase
MELTAGLELTGRDDGISLHRRYRPGLMAVIALALGIFLVDTFTPIGSAVAVLYVVVLVLASDLGGGSKVVKIASIACAVATMTSFAYGHGLDAATQAGLRVLFSLTANFVTAAVLLRREVEIEARHSSEKMLKASEFRYRTIFNTLAVAIWEHDFRDVKAELEFLRKQGVTNLRQYLANHPEFVSRARGLVRITDVNDTALRLMSVPTKQAFFTHLSCFLPENDHSFELCLIAIDEGHQAFQAETKVRDLNGKLIPVIVSLSFPADGSGLDRIQGSIIDITERLEFQEAIERSRRDLENAARAAMIGEISASIAHEVNQPLSATMTYIQAARRWLDRGVPDLKEANLALDQALSSTEHSANVVKRVRMLLGKAKSDTDEVPLEAIIQETICLKQAELLAHGTKLSFTPSKKTPIIVGDRILLQQAFINIITNAMQAMDATNSESRRISIVSELHDAQVTIKISDSGPGLGTNSGEHLFRAFNTTKETGMGLGLAMCRSIVSAHAGSISIDNRADGGGAIVQVTLPFIVNLAVHEDNDDAQNPSEPSTVAG